MSVSASFYLPKVHICVVYQLLLASCAQGYWHPLEISRDICISAIGNLYSGFFLFVVCFSLCLKLLQLLLLHLWQLFAPWHHPSPWLLNGSQLCGLSRTGSPWYGSATTVNRKEHNKGLLALLLHCSSNNLSPRCHWSSSDKFLSLRFEALTSSLCCTLDFVIVFTFCIQVSMLLPCSPVADQLLGFAMLDTYEYSLGRHAYW